MYKTGLRQDAFKQGSIRRDSNYRTNANWDEIMARLRKTASAGNIVIPDGSFRGLADTSTNPGTPTSNEWWSASEIGIYTNFGGIEVTSINGVYNWLVWNNDTTTWSIQQVPIDYTSFIPNVYDGILNFNLNSDLSIGATPYQSKKQSDPGYAYLYLGINSPTYYNNKLNLDGSLSLNRLNVYSTTESPILSDELNTNPTGWTTGAHWTNSGGGVYTCTAGSGLLSTTIPTTSGRRYLITWSSTGNFMQQAFTISVGASSVTVSANQTEKVCDVTASVTGASTTISFQLTSTANGTISNISIKELTPITSAIPAQFLHTTSSGIGVELRSNLIHYSQGLGLNSLRYLYTGSHNLAFGNGALNNITGGTYNIAIGTDSQSTSAIGHNNISIGYRSLYALTTGIRNIAIGNNALVACTTGCINIAIGYQAGVLLTTGNNNILIGDSTGRGLTTGLTNVIVGGNSFGINVSGAGNTGVGYQVLNACTGSSNTVLGHSAGGNLSTGSSNTLLGYSAGQGFNTGSYNVIVGSYNTLGQIGGIRLYYGLGFTSDSSNILIGYGATKQKISTALNNGIAIGNYARVYENNQVVLGNDEITSTYLRGNVEIRNHQVLASNSLSEPTFTTHTKWTETGDMAYNATKFTYTHSSGSGSLTQTSANFTIAIKPNTWYKLSYTITIVSGTGAVTGTINATLTGTAITMNTGNGTSFLYFKTGASTGNLKFDFISGGAKVFDFTFAGLEEVIGGDLYVNNDIEQRRGTYQYFRQYFGTDTDNDWRTCADQSGFHFQQRISGTYTSVLNLTTIQTKTTDYTILTTDSVIISNSSTTITFTLPSAIGSGRHYFIRNKGTGDLIIDGASSETINEELTQILTQGESIHIVDEASGVWGAY